MCLCEYLSGTNSDSVMLLSETGIVYTQSLGIKIKYTLEIEWPERWVVAFIIFGI